MLTASLQTLAWVATQRGHRLAVLKICNLSLHRDNSTLQKMLPPSSGWEMSSADLGDWEDEGGGRETKWSDQTNAELGPIFSLPATWGASIQFLQTPRHSPCEQVFISSLKPFWTPCCFPKTTWNLKKNIHNSYYIFKASPREQTRNLISINTASLFSPRDRIFDQSVSEFTINIVPTLNAT